MISLLSSGQAGNECPSEQSMPEHHDRKLDVNQTVGSKRDTVTSLQSPAVGEDRFKETLASLVTCAFDSPLFNPFRRMLHIPLWDQELWLRRIQFEGGDILQLARQWAARPWKASVQENYVSLNKSGIKIFYKTQLSKHQTAKICFPDGTTLIKLNGMY